MNELEVCNWALCKLGENPLDSLEERDNPHALRCKALLRPVHMSLLRRFDWKFPTFTEILSPLKQGRNDQWYYPLPHHFLQMIEPQYPHFVGGKFLSSSKKEALPIVYIKHVDSESADPLYCEALACKLALEMCVRVREAEGLKASIAREFDIAWENAIGEANKERKGEPVFYE